jgi:3-deoxy-manno-octulosonate cytidylyltransferase (CMP-KDO synthetase)
MIQHVYERACQARLADLVVVATDDTRIQAAVEAFGGRAVMTSAAHATGTDRVAEVVRQLVCDIVVNVQGDEPCVAPSAIDAIIQPLRDDTAVPIATLAHPLQAVADFLSPHVVKVVVDGHGHALYFSRAPIPYDRQAWPQAPHVLLGGGTSLILPPGCYRHFGLYAYRRDVLLHLAALPQTTLEQVEQLEQLRAMEHGYRLRVVLTTHESVGVDTPDDIARVEQILAGHA